MDEIQLAGVSDVEEINSQKKYLSKRYTELIENALSTPASWYLQSEKKDALL